MCHLTVGCIGFYTSYTVNLHFFDLVSLRWAVIKSVINCDLASFWNFLNSNHRACINTSLLLVIVSVRDCLGEHLDELVSSFTSACWKTLIQTSLALPPKQSTIKTKKTGTELVHHLHAARLIAYHSSARALTALYCHIQLTPSVCYCSFCVSLHHVHFW